MGKSTPKVPPPPNPQATAAAQSEANRDAIRESALVNRYNVVAPGYSVTWEPGGGSGQTSNMSPRSNAPAQRGPTQVGSDMNFAASMRGAPMAFGQFSGGFNASGGGSAFGNDPLYGMTQRIELDPQQQRIFDAQSTASELLTNRAVDMAGNLPNDPLTADGLPAQVTNINTGALPSVSGPNLQQSVTNPGVRNNVQGQGGNLQTSVGQAQQAQGVQGAGEGIQRSVDPTFQDAQFANRSAQINTTAPQAPELQMGVQSRAGDFNTNVNTGDLAQLETDFAGQRGNVEQAVFDRANSLLEPEFGQQRDQLLRNLADRGIPLTSEQGQRELDRLDRMQGEQRDRLAMSATIAGGQEQSRLFDLASRSRGQMVDERLATGAFRNAALDRMFGQDVTAGQFANNAADQGFRQQLAGQQVQNQAVAQAQGLDTQARQSANQARQQQFNQGLAAGQFGNEAQAQFFGQNLAAQDMANRAGQQNFNNRLAGATFGNQAFAQRQALDESAQAADNRARAQFFGQNIDAANFGNQAQTAQIGLEQARRDSALQEALMNASLQNQGRAVGLNERQVLRNQQFNELAGLIQGAPAMPMPGPMNPGALQMQAPDISGLIMGNYNQQVANAQQAAAARNSGISNVFSAGAGILGAGIQSGAWLGSDPAIKHDVGEPERFLDRVKRLPIKTWRYNEDPDTLHIGPMADDWARLFGGDGKVIHVVDAVGVLLKSVQELTMRVEAMEAA